MKFLLSLSFVLFLCSCKHQTSHTLEKYNELEDFKSSIYRIEKEVAEGRQKPEFLNDYFVVKIERLKSDIKLYKRLLQKYPNKANKYTPELAQTEQLLKNIKTFQASRLQK